MNNYESELLWTRYSFMEGGLAIQSTFDKMVTSLRDTSHGIYIGKIKYMDWDTESTPNVNITSPIITKKKNYQDENVLRAAIIYFHVLKKRKEQGIRVRVNLTELRVCHQPLLLSQTFLHYHDLL
jgi:hypothetical protein